MSLLHVSLALLLVVSVSTLTAAQTECYSKSQCDAFVGLRERLTIQLCVLQIRTDGKICYVPSKCLNNPCFNGGICLPPDPVFGGYYPYFCKCPAGRVGEQCQWLSPKDCVTNKCSTTGSTECTSNADGLFCRCKQGYGGWHCEIATPCTKYPCSYAPGCEEHNRGQKGRSCYDAADNLVDKDI